MRRLLDGHISRALEGKTVRCVSKDGTFMTFFCTNGEQWRVGWADFIKGVGFSGEPAIVSVDDMRLGAGAIDTPDGSVHNALQGQEIESARTDGTVLYIKTAQRTIGIAWVDPETRERIVAEPCLSRVDVAVRIDPVQTGGAVGRV